MENGSFVKGQNVNTPQGKGYVVDVIGDELTVKLEGGETITCDQNDVVDDSDAG
jgi:hypothetical protein